MTGQELVWEEPGLCPSCDYNTGHTWFRNTLASYLHPVDGELIESEMIGSQGTLLVSQCMSSDCEALALWIKDNENVVRLVYPQSVARFPPQKGLTEDETELYEEAVAVAPASRRAACALLRVLLEAFLERHLTHADHNVEGMPLVGMIELAVDHLELSQSLKDGLTAVRERGNTAVHDPYGLTDDTRTDDLPWLFQAVDDLVEDLHTKPEKWAGIAGT